MKLLPVLLLICFSTGLPAQNGKLISRQRLVFPDSVQRQLDRNPEFAAIRSDTEIFQITYRSDSLNINGYLARPKKPGTYPVIIFNRGGNRDFGALTDSRALYLLGTMARWG